MSRGHGHQPKHVGAERPAPPRGGSGVQPPPAPLPAVFRWDGGGRSFFAYSGSRIIGHVVCRSTDDKWVWAINDVQGSRHLPATRGACSSEEGAKRALRRAWLRWLAERGLQEIRP